MNVTVCKIANTLGKRLMANETLYKKTCMTWKIAIKPFKVMKRTQNLKYEKDAIYEEHGYLNNEPNQTSAIKNYTHLN